MPTACGAQFRQDVVDVARKGPGAAGADCVEFGTLGHRAHTADRYRRA